MFDHNGLMWIGTDQGVCAYDGYRFKAYRNDAYSPGILPNNYVLRMTEAPENRLWFGTHDGLACFNRRKSTFKSYRLQSQNARSIDALFTSSDGTIWVGTANGVSRYDAKNDDFIDISLPAGVRSFSEDKKGNIYIGTWEGGLLRLDHHSGKLVSYPRLSERNTVQSQLIDSRGRLWIGTWERFYRGKTASTGSFGIGLSLARRILSQQDCTLKAANRPSGGAMFSLRFYRSTI